MFEVARWPGPTDDSKRKGGSSLSLQELNARARQRAELRTGKGTGKGDAVDLDGGRLDPGGKNTPAVDGKEVVGNESKTGKKRKKRDGAEEGTLPAKTVMKEIEPVIVPLNKKDKKGKKRRTSQSTGSDEDTIMKQSADITVQAPVKRADVSAKNRVEVEIPIADKKRKKKRIDRGLPGSATQVCSMGNVGERDSNLELSKPQKKKSREEEKELSDEIEVPDNNAHTEQHPFLDSRAELPPGDAKQLSVEDVDLSRIERDVEKILGHDLLTSKTPAGSQKKAPAVLPWMRDPLEIDKHKALPLSQVPFLDLRLQDALKKTGIKALFPVQVAVWHETLGPGCFERDLCVCSPTGSGKTLSYALPIVQKLSTRVIPRLRALVVLPTRDLASQVKAVFDTIAPSVGLKVGLAVGQTSIIAEAAQLVKFQKQIVHSFGGGEGSDRQIAESCIDILVATPGRLMDHLWNTRDFTLEHLLYLVVDETDRLLRQSYQDWLPNVLNAVAATESRNDSVLGGSVLNGSIIRSVHTVRHLGLERGLRGSTYPRLMKMVLSATLTRDPSKIGQLSLHSPMYIAQSTMDNRYQLPEQLQAFKLVCKPGEKPLYLAALLQQLAGQQTIVFTASVVATHRLFTLLSFFKDLSFKLVEYSSLQHQQIRSKALARFREGEAQVLVASDAMTRGMDVEGVGNVVNYDMPVYAKTYVHRVGRTARAGRAGCSYTLLRREEVRHFKSLLKKADNSTCKDYRLPASATENLYDQYLAALEQLKQVTKEESSLTQPLSKGSIVQGLRGEQMETGVDDIFL